MTDSYRHLRERLEAERKRLAEELAKIQTTASTSDERREGSPFGKREEEATETMELEKRLALENRIRQEMSGVEKALEKFEKGTYGLCENCGQPIALERLEALPQATLCVKCKALAKDGRITTPPR
ncbi:MAG: TraR/DksA C4-type zinc finger protein [Dehalococcoidales bacterium]|nr:TraR/DksA C4-type zinc finger protein [Dehalococcoidales bacterium]